MLLLRGQLSIYRPDEDNLTHDIDQEILNAVLKGTCCDVYKYRSCYYRSYYRS